MILTMIEVGLIVGCIGVIIKLVTRIVRRFGDD